MACTQGTTSLAERPEPQGRRTESLYYLSLIVGKKAGQRTQTRVIPTKSAFPYCHPEAAHRRATYPRVGYDASMRASPTAIEATREEPW